MTLHHKAIRRFQVEGSIYNDAHIQRLRTEYLALLVLSMKTDGYVPRYEIDPDFTIDYQGADGYAFKLSVYGCFVGKKKAQMIDGMTGYTPRFAVGVEQEEPVKKEV